MDGRGSSDRSYYDVGTNDVCGSQNGGPFPANWATTSGINAGIPFCNDNTDTRGLNAWDSNRIVAMDWNMLSADKAKWCGKEVQIFDASGKQITIDEGPFILWDACAACMSSKIIDLSAKGFVAASPDGKCGNNPEGLTVKVLNNDIRNTLGAGPAPAPAPAQSSSSSEAPASSAAPSASPSAEPSSSSSSSPAPSAAAPSAPAAAEILAATPPDVSSAIVSAESAVSSAASSVASEHSASAAAAPSETPAAPAVPTAAACTFGTWRCHDLALEVCNYQTTETLGWDEVAKCASECSFTETGSAICH